MGSPAVSLHYYCRTPEGWRRFPAAFGRNGKIRPRYAQVGKAQIQYEQGHYELPLMKDGRRVWQNVGEDAASAQATSVS